MLFTSGQSSSLIQVSLYVDNNYDGQPIAVFVNWEDNVNVQTMIVVIYNNSTTHFIVYPSLFGCISTLCVYSTPIVVLVHFNVGVYLTPVVVWVYVNVDGLNTRRRNGKNITTGGLLTVIERYFLWTKFGLNR